MTVIFPNYRLTRLSWGAIIAGAILALVVYLILSVLGTAIGASVIAPSGGPSNPTGFAFATGVWVMFAMVLSTLAGAYMAGRSAPDEGWLHGLLAWAIVTLGTVSLASTVVGGSMDVVFGTAHQAITAAAQGGTVSPDAMHIVARATWWGFALLIVGAAISMAAGAMGQRHRPVVVEEVVTDERVVPARV